MQIIHRGDQYYIPVKIKFNGVAITPSDVDDVRIKVGVFLKSYDANQVTYDTTSGKWLYPLTEQMSQSLDSNTMFQVGIKRNSETEYIYSDTVTLTIGSSIITEGWATA